MPPPTGLHLLWPTPIGLHRYAGAAAVKPALLDAFAGLRDEQRRRRGEAPGPFFASDDDLLERVDVEGWKPLVQFIVDGIARTVEEANTEAWAGRVRRLRVAIEGMWFQTSAGGAGHDVHGHGNCSWSGVYVVQADGGDGVTRLYGPHLATLGGAHVDVGNAYLQPPHLDVEPVEGQLLVFPSWLLHQAMPHDGERERVIISFNASVHGSEGDRLHGYAAR